MLWQRLLSKDTPVSLGIISIPDVRVSPIIASRWGQTTVNGKNVYNYYTPNNYPCGCSATALSQPLRFYQFPTTSITPITRECTVNGNKQNLTTMGGSYNWNNMPLTPNSQTTLAERQNIGKLTYDTSVLLQMSFTATGSGSYINLAHDALANEFAYTSTCVYTDHQNGINDTLRQRAILPNLDAGAPVILGIVGNGGHAILADGYGFSDSTLYVHLNMGWEGSADAWYNLPNIDDPYFGFNSVVDVIYNISPNSSGELLSGRITSTTGLPLAGVTVSATKSQQTWSATTTANGIYAIRLPAAKNYNLVASLGQVSSSRTVSLSASTPTEFAGPGSYYIGSGNIGNSWGNNFTLDIPEPPTITEIQLQTAVTEKYFQLSFNSQAGRIYQILSSTSLITPQWNSVTNITATTSGTTTIKLPIPLMQKTAFYRVVTE